MGLYSTAQGALTQLYAGTSPEGVEFNGKVSKPDEWRKLTMTSALHPSSISGHGRALSSPSPPHKILNLGSSCGHGLRSRLPISKFNHVFGRSMLFMFRWRIQGYNLRMEANMYAIDTIRYVCSTVMHLSGLQGWVGVSA
jgi:hypothetical protein